MYSYFEKLLNIVEEKYDENFYSYFEKEYFNDEEIYNDIDVFVDFLEVRIIFSLFFCYKY